MSFSNADTGSKPEDPYKEKNREETSVKEKIEDLATFVDKHKFCMMTTRIADSGLLASRCMGVAAKEDNNTTFLFHSNTESGKTDDLDSDNDVNLAFLDPSGQWASISGRSSIDTDRETVRKYYRPDLKAWIGDLGDGKHDGGPEDPRICVIRVKAVTAQYAINNRTQVGQMVEVAKGIVTGDSPSVNKLRYLSEEEIEQCAYPLAVF
ncbi:hypothetical protein W97_03056 [Coniosporium apollinis CBS 100218]|uniref:General stress protein FMN-binding split barrel domain-containing protein n=1 Tax=Coniosporium apollinis (strain CBS 100218) TaxID=1168221 RepID=R7YPQ0_CONA1|nr:uncharacterized protein W97_03056 [Coniosporium apollinis CBS 100218]EON63828.1 hypothetical protein W97_03056 [Coniosporium apollinis CBS 100218]